MYLKRAAEPLLRKILASALEIKWSPRRVSGRAFHDAYGVTVQAIRADNPFAVDIFNTYRM